MSKQLSINAYDKKIMKQIAEFLPARIFDVHAHIYRETDLHTEIKPITSGDTDFSMGVWKSQLADLLDGKNPEGGLFFPDPISGMDLNGANNYLIQQIKKEKYAKGVVVVSPETNREQLSYWLKQPGIVGIKPYHSFSEHKPTWESSISDFLPDWQLVLCNSHNAIVMLHLVKKNAIADSDNIREIRQISLRYPNLKIILAHAARSFHAYHAKEGIKALRGLENVWFDTSAICEPTALTTILHEFGPHKLMWGSDFPVSHMRGKVVTLGDGFVWLDDDSCNWEKSQFANPVIVGIESLRALKTAAEEFGLNNTDIQNIFFHNAFQLLFEEQKEQNQTQELYCHAKKRIPGGTQLLSKRPENMAPGVWPAYFREARGCEVWDLDGKHYYDMTTNGIGSCLLGYSDSHVNAAVLRRIHLGSMSSLNSPEEVTLADRLCELHPWAEQVRFTRTGGEACAVAVRIARATTHRNRVAICGYHGWHDWYLAANLGESDELKGHLLPGLDPSGVPTQLRDTTLAFSYNDLPSFQKIMQTYGSSLAAVIMEPCRSVDPDPGFLSYIREETRRNGIILIFDEITIGWRLYFGGAHLHFGIYPDIAVFGKALGNGYPIGAIIGTSESMEGAHYSFISSTYWTEGVGPAASLATLEKMNSIDVVNHIAKVGTMTKQAWETSGKKYGLPIEVNGFPCLAHFGFQSDESEKLRTIYTQLMLKKGFLAGCSIYPTMAHTDDIMSHYFDAIDKVFQIMAESLHAESIDSLLEGKVAHSGFTRLTK